MPGAGPVNVLVVTAFKSLEKILGQRVAHKKGVCTEGMEVGVGMGRLGRWLAKFGPRIYHLLPGEVVRYSESCFWENFRKFGIVFSVWGDVVFPFKPSKGF